MIQQTIPRIIHQSYHIKNLSDSLNNNIAKLKNINPNWEYRLYDDKDQINFISNNYESQILKAYLKINPLYGVARADFFRYLLIYKVGGIWLDIKSTMNKDMDTIIQKNDSFLLSQWSNRMGEPSQGWGLHYDLRHIPGGEFHQWHIISSPRNPLIKAVIEKVFKNIHTYSIEEFGVGSIGVWRTTGPIAYTLAMSPLLKRYPHRFVNIEKDLQFEYSIFEQFIHRKLSKKHYSQIKEPIVL